MNRNERIRLKVADQLDNISYIVIANGKVTYISVTETPLALSNISPKAAELRFRLEDADTPGQALKAVRELAAWIKNVEVV